MRFDDLNLAPAVLRAVHAEGYDTPTPIQQKAIPHVLAGRDLVGCAQTGTGKTAAFALPVLTRLESLPGQGPRPRVLVLTPTRELAIQIGESFETYGKFTRVRAGLVYGGVGQGAQERMLRSGIDVLVATPGRLMDLMGQGLVDLGQVSVFILDEADRMLDMGFIHDIRRVIAKLPARRQNLLFSATMPPEIQRLADGLLHNPVRVAVAPVSSTAERVEQSVYHVAKSDKPALLAELLDADHTIHRVLIFTRTKHGADRLAKSLARRGVSAEAIHGNKSQNQRQRALDAFKQGRCRVLVATDIAARGLDIEEVSHVINYELPNVPESYVHRIGRTARAGESGVAISFCDGEEREYLRDIERVIARRIPVIPTPPLPPPAQAPRPAAASGSGHGGGAGRPSPNPARRGAPPRRDGRGPAQRAPARGGTHSHGRRGGSR